MDIQEIQFDLATRDIYLKKIENQVMAKRRLLLYKQKELRKTAKQNQFLEEVQSDYARYYNFIIKQKESQIRSMNIIKQYLNDIVVSGKLTKEDIVEAQKEQASVLHEIDNVKVSINKIMRETNGLKYEENIKK
jgi:uncharacterized membrane protein